jgi:hypothetical protein
VVHDGATTLIATLSGADHEDWDGSFTGRVTPDGTRLAFESTRSVTGYDNTIGDGASSCGTLTGNRNSSTGSPRCGEVFLYNAVSDRLVCASCNPSGARPLGASYLSTYQRPTDRESTVDAYGFAYLPRNLSNDGARLFFESEDALVPGDVNNRRDVYQYEDGQARLISSGTGNEDSRFLDASPSGDDVFIETSARLVTQDTDQRPDIYDARVGGGFPDSPVATSCVGDACRSLPVVSSVGQSLGSADGSGPGNVFSSPPVGVAPKVVVRPRVLTRAQKLAAALKVCKREPKRRRASCVARARRLYGSQKAKKATRRLVRGAK